MGIILEEITRPWHTIFIVKVEDRILLFEGRKCIGEVLPLCYGECDSEPTLHCKSCKWRNKRIKFQIYKAGDSVFRYIPVKEKMTIEEIIPARVKISLTP